MEHWQEDNTASRRGLSENPDYDKLSNVETLTFYIQGESSAPWITYIKTDPEEVKEGDAYRLLVGVDDEEKDILRLDVEVNKEGKVIFRHRSANLTPDANGKYPEAVTGWAPDPASPGIYEVVCTVRDDTSAGVGSYRFMVVSAGKVTGWVSHTEEWEKNRKKYNLARKEIGEEVDREIPFDIYIGMDSPRPRGTNVFWSGERFELKAAVTGDPLWVRVSIPGTSYAAALTNTCGKNASGETLWTGSLWDRSMINKWGRKEPEQLIFLFEANYGEAGIRAFHVPVILDSETDYWQLHRLW
ncbi:MAG: hypothetical protein E7224_02670 [Clostridiales bacterium]|nr:hypothetical protein [Clostridiales bacterium]